MKVKVWIEKIIIPTYETGAPDKNPMFFEKRVYQGSSGAVYPNPVIEKIFDDKTDKEYTGVFLENDFLKIMVLPELGGRIQMAFDKLGNRHFVYYNQVIKPALVGLCGPWISGGIEFNWPQHHRPSTFEAVDYEIEENADGSATVWVNEVEKMFHTKGMAGFTLHPHRAYMEIKAKVSNPTALPQTFLWWANPAVKVNDYYQSVFPPDVNAVFDHGKRDVSSFPIATGTYYKVDYSPGTDISMYKNIPVPTSYMAVNSDYDFVGGYEHDSRGGMLHVADHHVSPGKKQWTWGNGDFGVAWDRNLTDEDGPYIELMTGVFTDNQPDFTWLMPFEEKTFTQYFLPYRELGLIKNATKDILLTFDTTGDSITFGLFATSAMNGVQISVVDAGQTLLQLTADLAAGQVFRHTWNADMPVNKDAVSILVCSGEGKKLISYLPLQKPKEIPQAASPALTPAELDSPEQLFLTGQHLEQYRHATFDPVPYYEKALQLDAGDSRNNNALGAWYLRRGQFAKSEAYFRTAIHTITQRNPNPYDGEPYFNLGLSLWYQGRTDLAYSAFFKATWNSAWQDAACFYVAKIDLLRGDYDKALEHINWSLDRNARNGKAYLLKIMALKKAGLAEDALLVAEEAIRRDTFNFAALYELHVGYQYLGQPEKASATLDALLNRSRQTSHNHIEFAIEYIEIGAFHEALAILQLIAAEYLAEPLVNYYLAYINHRLNNHQACQYYLGIAAAANPGASFPNRLQDILVLQFASAHNITDSKAPYYLGNIFYDKRQYDDAIACWSRSYELDNDFATVNRNLGIAYFNKSGDQEAALFHFEKAYEADNSDARVLMELDQLYRRINKQPAERLAFLEKHHETVVQRDDLYLEMATLHNLLGDTAKACDLLMARKFHPWEGGEGKVSAQYVHSLIELAKVQLKQGQYQAAVALLSQSLQYPENLGEGKLPGTRDNDVYFWLGNAYLGLGDGSGALNAWRKALEGEQEPSAAVFYNDSPPDKIFYQGLACLKTGDAERASAIFQHLIRYGHQHMNDEIKIDYFAVSLPDLLVFESNLDQRNKIHCFYLLGLGNLGLNNRKEASYYFNEILQQDAAHIGAQTHLQLVDDSILSDLLFQASNVAIS